MNLLLQLLHKDTNATTKQPSLSYESDIVLPCDDKENRINHTVERAASDGGAHGKDFQGLSKYQVPSYQVD